MGLAMASRNGPTGDTQLMPIPVDALRSAKLKESVSAQTFPASKKP